MKPGSPSRWATCTAGSLVCHKFLQRLAGFHVGHGCCFGHFRWHSMWTEGRDYQSTQENIHVLHLLLRNLSLTPQVRVSVLYCITKDHFGWKVGRCHLIIKMGKWPRSISLCMCVRRGPYHSTGF